MRSPEWRREQAGRPLIARHMALWTRIAGLKPGSNATSRTGQPHREIKAGASAETSPTRARLGPHRADNAMLRFQPGSQLLEPGRKASSVA